VSFQPLDPAAILATLVESGVDFVLIGALAVGIHADVRGTGDVDIMVPAGDTTNRRALGRALLKLGAERIPSGHGGVDPTERDPYPTLMFRTRHGKLDVLYRPDGSDAYAAVKRRSLRSTVGGQPIAVAGKDDMIRMKLAAGRPNDLIDVANMTASERGAPRRIAVTMTLADGAEPEWARELATERVSLFDPRGRVSLEGGRLRIVASRSDLTDSQLRQWARALGERLHGAGLLADTAIDVVVSEP
jgi:hypothetical protein